MPALRYLPIHPYSVDDLAAARRPTGLVPETMRAMAKTTPVEFIQQVQAERKKVVWPTWKETWMTGLMVAILTTVLAVFFFGIDTVFETVVTALLKLAQ